MKDMVRSSGRLAVLRWLTLAMPALMFLLFLAFVVNPA
jgi:hypothetical protein